MTRSTVTLAAALAIALVLPLGLSAFYVVLLTEIAVAALFATAFNLLMGFGGMVSFDVGSLEAARTVLESVKLCTLAESLGGVETLISHPATMTHASVLPETRSRLGITDGLVRISVGIEDTDDIVADLDQALKKA